MAWAFFGLFWSGLGTSPIVTPTFQVAWAVDLFDDDF